MTQVLSRDRYDAALAFVRQEARPLEVALLNHALGDAGPEPALLALSEFQNPDGGFGGGLESDMQGPASTAIATSVALRLLLRVGAAARQPMVAGALGWLAQTLDRERGVWWIVGPGDGHAPHAPWWAWSEDAIGSDDLAGAKLGFAFNPTAELLSQLYAWRDAAAPGVIETVEAQFRRSVDEIEVIESAYDLKCAAKLAESPAAPADLRGQTERLVRRSIEAHDPDDEHLSVLELAPTPTSLFADAISDRLETAVERLIAGQQDNGGWALFWDWSFVDAKAWAKAKRDSRGWVTREAIETLRAWGRIGDT